MFHEQTAFGPGAYRTEGRIAIIRTAKLVCDFAEYPCVLRDISADCLRVRLYSPLPAGQSRLHLVFGDGESHAVTLAWQRENEIGLSFLEVHDLLALLGTSGPFRKRAIRIAVSAPTQIKSLAGTQDAMIRNISHDGALIACDAHFALDQRVKLTVPNLGDVHATVRWRRAHEYGLAFVETFRFEVMAAIVGKMQAAAPIPAARQGTNATC